MEVPTLAAGDIELRPWQAADAEWYVSNRDELVFVWTREEPDLTVEGWQTRREREAVDSGSGSFAITRALSGELLGSIGVEVGDEVVELSYWVAPEARGHGVATSALAASAFWAANHFQPQRLELVTHPENVASQRVAEKAGFRASGTRECSHTCADENGMVALYVRTL